MGYNYISGNYVLYSVTSLFLISDVSGLPYFIASTVRPCLIASLKQINQLKYTALFKEDRTMAEETNDREQLGFLVSRVGDSRLYEAIFNIVQEAQAAGSVVQIITIWPATGENDSGDGIVRPTKCGPTGACPK